MQQHCGIFTAGVALADDRESRRRGGSQCARSPRFQRGLDPAASRSPCGEVLGRGRTIPDGNDGYFSHGIGNRYLFSDFADQPMISMQITYESSHFLDLPLSLFELAAKP